MDLIYEELLTIPNCPVRFYGDSEIMKKEINRFSIDSRTIDVDEVFIAIEGDKFDGHKFVFDLLNQEKATEFIVANKWFEQQDASRLTGNFFIVDDTIHALQEVSHYYRLKFHLPILGLTGSNGKTTTKEMIAAVIQKKYQVHKNKGNLNNHIGVPLTLFELNQHHQFAIIEMGTNFWGEIARLAEIASPNHGLITNIGPAHLEFFKNLEGVFKAKSELWQHLERNDGVGFVNLDDPFLRKDVPHLKEKLTYGFTTDADVRGEFLATDKQGRASFQVDDLKIELKISGVHNSHNALAAFAVGKYFGIEPDAIKTALEDYQAADKRMEVIQKKGLTIINDSYNSNPESAKKALQTLSAMETNGRRWAILGDMFELGDVGQIEHKKIGEYVVGLKNIDYLITHGKLSVLTVEKAADLGMRHTCYFDEKAELIEFVKKDVRAGDTILVKGSRGMAMEEVTEALVN